MKHTFTWDKLTGGGIIMQIPLKFNMCRNLNKSISNLRSLAHEEIDIVILFYIFAAHMANLAKLFPDDHCSIFLYNFISSSLYIFLYIYIFFLKYRLTSSSS